MSSGKYDDIIGLPAHVSKIHPRMSMHSRAAQFAPFAALSGYDDEITEEARLTGERMELGDEDRAELDRKLELLERHLKERPEVLITYFVPDGRKSGGEYRSEPLTVKKVRRTEDELLAENGRTIRLSDIIGMEAAIFDKTSKTEAY